MRVGDVISEEKVWMLFEAWEIERGSASFQHPRHGRCTIAKCADEKWRFVNVQHGDPVAEAELPKSKTAVRRGWRKAERRLAAEMAERKAGKK